MNVDNMWRVVKPKDIDREKFLIKLSQIKAEWETRGEGITTFTSPPDTHKMV